MRWLILLLIILLVEFYAYQAIRTLFQNPWIRRGYRIFSVLILGFIVYQFFNFDRKVGQTQIFLMATGLLLLVYIPKTIVALFLLMEDFIRLYSGILRKFSSNKISEGFMPGRRKFVSTMALGVASIPFLSILYGIYQGRYDFRVLKQTLFFEDLPDEFDGFTLMQISDIHSGSFDNPKKIQYGIDLINQQKFDLLVFTGDLVNNFAHEMDDWVEMFSGIKTPKFGKYSVLGNHDYGEYSIWDSEEQKAENLKKIKEIHPRIGFQLLLNEHISLKKGDSEIKLVGVENWGAGRFQKYGDLAKASEGLKNEDFKILLSHDPSHWDEQVLKSSLDYHLTLSGHTHGMQFGIEIPGWVKWSPVKYMYKRWAGLYQEGKKYLYVNRGFGYHAYPGRVGIWPEITLIELKKKGNV